MFLFRSSKPTVLVAGVLLFLLAVGACGLKRYVQAGQGYTGPSGDTAEKAAELDQEIQEIGQVIRERQGAAALEVRV